MLKHTGPISGKPIKFTQLASQWLLSVACGIKESTLAHYQYTLSRYLLPVFGECRLSALDEQQLEQGLLQVIAPQNGSHKPLGSSSSRECLTTLRRICNDGAHLRLIRRMEICVKLPQCEKRPTAPLSPAEQEAVQAFVWRNPTVRKMGLGLRMGEVCGLQWGDFDFEADALTICRTVSRIYCGAGRNQSCRTNAQNQAFRPGNSGSP